MRKINGAHTHMAIRRAALAAVLFLPLLVAFPSALHQPVAQAVQEDPNIIVIMVDDAREDDLTQGTALADTRDIIATGAGNGTRYDNFISSHSLCCPSRTTFLTGQYEHNHGVLSNHAPDGGWAQFHNNGTEQTDTLPIWLDAAGYRTMMIGKYLNGYGEAGDGEPDTFIPNGWDFWVSFVHGVGYSTYDLNVNGAIQSQTGSHYSTTDFTNRATFQLDANLDSDVPIFMWLSYFAPHKAGSGPDGMCNVPAESQYTGVSNAGLPSSIAFNEPNVADKPAWIQSKPQFTQTQKNAIEDCRNERLDSLRSVDDAVVDIRDTLVAHGELSNTILVFLSDNGLMLGEHRLCDPCNKQWAYEETVGTPLAVRNAPNIPTGVLTRMTSNTDIAASIVEWAGASAPDGFIDGQPLDSAPPPSGEWRAVNVEKLSTNQATPPIYTGVRVRNTWMLADYTSGLDELYDGATQEQTDNKIQVSSYDDEEAELRAIVDELEDCSGWVDPASASNTDCNVTWTP